MNEKTHFRKAFKSPYLSSADIVEPTVLTIKRVCLEQDKTKKTKDDFNTAYFVEPTIRSGEPLKPMILNAHNSRVMKELGKSSFIDDWNNIPVTIYVDHNVNLMGSIVDGLRISTEPPRQNEELTVDHKRFNDAVDAYKRDGNLDSVKQRMIVSKEVEAKVIEAAKDANIS